MLNSHMHKKGNAASQRHFSGLHERDWSEAMRAYTRCNVLEGSKPVRVKGL